MKMSSHAGPPSNGWCNLKKIIIGSLMEGIQPRRGMRNYPLIKVCMEDWVTETQMVELDMWESSVARWRNRSKYKTSPPRPERNATLSLICCETGQVNTGGPDRSECEGQTLPVTSVKTEMCKTVWRRSKKNVFLNQPDSTFVRSTFLLQLAVAAVE